MLDKLSILRIIADHIDTLRDYRTNKLSRSDVLLFLFFPFVVSGAVTYSYGALQTSPTEIFAASLSVFAALLFSLLVLVYDSFRDRRTGDTLSLRFLTEIFRNISFAI